MRSLGTIWSGPLRGLDLLGGLGAGEVAHGAAVRVDDVDGDLARGRPGQDVVDQSAGRGIFAQGMTRVDLIWIVESHSRLRRVERRGVACGRGLSQGSQVGEDPERPTMGRGDQIVTLDRDVVDGRGGQAFAQTLPCGAIVERDEDAELGPGVEQARPHGVLAHRVNHRAHRKTGGD